MRFFALILALLQLPLAAFAADYALMVNMNYSSHEWAAFQQSAENCGRIPISIPPVEMIPVGEAVFAKRDALTLQLQKARPGWKKNELDNAIDEIMRSGEKWQGDPEVAAAFRPAIRDLHRQTKLLNKAEEKYGTIAEQ